MSLCKQVLRRIGYAVTHRLHGGQQSGAFWILTVCVALALPMSGRAAERGSIAADELERLVHTLENDSSRTQLIEDLRALIAVQRGADPFALARAIDAFSAAARGKESDTVVIASADDPGYAMPAAAWAAKSGDPVLFVNRDAIPAETRAATHTHDARTASGGRRAGPTKPPIGLTTVQSTSTETLRPSRSRMCCAATHR